MPLVAPARRLADQTHRGAPRRARGQDCLADKQDHKGYCVCDEPANSGHSPEHLRDFSHSRADSGWDPVADANGSTIATDSIRSCADCHNFTTDEG